MNTVIKSFLIKVDIFHNRNRIAFLGVSLIFQVKVAASINKYQKEIYTTIKEVCI